MISHGPKKLKKANVAILLRLSSALHRDRLVGMFNRLSPSIDWNIHLAADEAELRNILAGRGFPADGIVTFMPRESATRKALSASSIPLVAFGLDETLERDRTTAARFLHNDNAALGHTTCEFLMRLGNFSDFAVVHDRLGRPWSKARGGALVAELKRRRRACRTFETNSAGEEDIHRLAAFLRSLNKPAAVFATHDERSVDVLRAAREAGCRVPEDLSVIGVDDDKLVCEHSRPRLSSVRIDGIAAGERAADELTALLRARNVGRTRAKSVTLQTILNVIERESTHGLTPARHLIDRARAYIRENAFRGITPPSVARALGVSRRLLDLRFREGGEPSILQCINGARTDEVCRLLTTTELPVSRIFESAGFGDIHYANHLFKATTGTTPTQYRRAKAQATPPGAIAQP